MSVQTLDQIYTSFRAGFKDTPDFAIDFYRNNYFKNQAIYHHSLAGMPHVRFVKRTPFSLAQYFRVMYWARMRPVEMKFRRVFQGRRVVTQG